MDLSTVDPNTALIALVIVIGSSWLVAEHITKKRELEELHHWILFFVILLFHWPLGLLLAFIPAKKKEGNT